MRVQEKCNQEVVTTGELTINAKDLPEGWTSESLGDVTRDIRYGYTAKATAIKAGPKYLRITDIQDNTVDWNMVPFCEIESSKFNSYRLSAGDLVFARTGATTGKSYLIKTCPDSVFASYLIRVRPSAALLPEYVAAFFQSDSYWNQITENLSGSAQPNCNASKLASLLVPIPPLPEQRRIVAKLEALLSKVSTTQQRLSRVPGLLKRFRQSVLAAACSGKLTADWREENKTEETGEKLLSRIKAIRLKFANTAKEKKEIETAFSPSFLEITEEELSVDSLPETWKACRIGAAGTVSNGSTPSRQQASFWDGNIPWISSGQVRNNHITTTRERITNAGFDNTSLRLLPRGTVLIAMIGEGKTRGQSAILALEATINQNIAAIVISHGLVESTFLWLWFQMRYEATREQGAGSGPQALNCQRVRELPFVLPPQSEQKEIVRRVEKLFAFADQIESRLKQAQAQVDRLTQSLLAKAFRGELVPTEAELARQQGRPYESANELLARIRATQTTPTKRTRSKAGKE
jgi:type I restriction enzyme S subunit